MSIILPFPIFDRSLTSDEERERRPRRVEAGDRSFNYETGGCRDISSVLVKAAWLAPYPSNKAFFLLRMCSKEFRVLCDAILDTQSKALATMSMQWAGAAWNSVNARMRERRLGPAADEESKQQTLAMAEVYADHSKVIAATFSDHFGPHLARRILSVLHNILPNPPVARETSMDNISSIVSNTFETGAHLGGAPRDQCNPFLAAAILRRCSFCGTRRYKPCVCKMEYIASIKSRGPQAIPSGEDGGCLKVLYNRIVFGREKCFRRELMVVSGNSRTPTHQSLRDSPRD